MAAVHALTRLRLPPSSRRGHRCKPSGQALLGATLAVAVWAVAWTLTLTTVSFVLELPGAVLSDLEGGPMPLFWTVWIAGLVAGGLASAIRGRRGQPLGTTLLALAAGTVLGGLAGALTGRLLSLAVGGVDGVAAALHGCFVGALVLALAASACARSGSSPPAAS